MSISFAATPQAKEAQQARTYTDPSAGAPPSRRSGANAPYIDKDHWNKVFTEPEYFDAIAKQKGMAEGAKVSLHGDDYVYRQAMIGYMSATRNVPLDDMRKIFDAEKDGFAKKVLGKQTASARELFDWHKSKFERDNEKQGAARQIMEGVIQRSLQDALSGGDTPFVESVAKDIDAASDYFDDEEKSRLWEKAEELDMKIRATQDRFAPEARFIFDALQQYSGQKEGFGAPDMRELAGRFASLPENQRRAIYELVGGFASITKTDKGFFYQLAESLGRGTTDITERVPRNFREQTLRGQLRLLESDQPVFRATGVAGAEFSAAGSTPVLGATQGQMLTPDEREQAKAKIQADLGVLKVERELRDLAERVVDPIKMTGVLPEIIEEGLYGAARSIPYTAAAAVPFAGVPAVAAALFSSNYDNIMLEYPDLDPDKAALIAAISAPIEAGLERMKVNTITGRLPVFGGLVKRLQHPNQRNIVRIAIGGAGIMAEQNVQEIVQNATFPFVRTIAAALDEDMPDYDWAERIEGMPRELAVQFVALLPLSLMGIGALSYREISRGEQYLRSKDNLERAGYSEDQIDRITGAATADEAQSILREESKKRDPKLVKAAAQRIVDESIALREKANPAALPRLEKQGADYVVLSPEGKELARERDQTAAEQALVSARRETVQREMRDVHTGINEAVEFIQKVNEARQRGEDVAEVIRESAPRTLLTDYEANPTQENLDRLFETVRAFGQEINEPAELANFPVIGSNQGALAEGIWRSVIRINEGADGTIVMREFAQDNLKRAIAEGRTTMDFVRQQLNDILPQIDSDRMERQLRTETDTDVIEAFSDIAVAYFRGSIREEQIPAGLRGIMRRLAIATRDIFRRAYNLARLRAEGKLDRDFEALLAEAVGVNQQALVDRARERTEQEVGAAPEVANYSIGALGDDNPFMHPRSADGKYKGAPKWINAPKTRRGKDEAYMRLRERLYQLVQEGAAGRFWYEDSGRAVLRMFNNNVVEAEKFIELLAIYSPQATVEVNTYFALRAYIQRAVNAAKEDFAVKTGAQDDKAKSVLYDNQPWAGRKTDNFYKNIMYVLLKELPASEVAKLKLDAEVYEMLQKPVTVDMWVYRAFGFDSDALTDVAGTGAFGFAERELNLIAEELNASLPEGVPPYLPHQIQAMLWTAIKGRAETKEVKDLTEAQSMKANDMVKVKNAQGKLVREFKDKEAQKRHMQRWITNALALPAEKLDVSMAAGAFDRFINSVSMRALWESVPSTNTPEGAAIANLTTAQKAAFTRASREIILDENGNDMLASMLGVPINVSQLLSGGYGTGATPNVVTELFPNKPSGTYDDDVVRAYARAIQYIYRQDAVPWMRYIKYGAENEKSYYAESPKGAKRRFATQAEAEAYAAGKEGYVVKGDAENFAVRLDFGEQLTSEFLDQLQQGLVKVHESLGFTQVSPTQVIVTNFRDSQTGLPALTDEEFSKRLGEVYGQQADIAELYTVGEYGPVHDWSADPEGGSILQASSRFGPDLLEWLRGRRQVSDALQKDWAEGRGVVSNYSIGTSAFQAWFADSKVVDDQGNPLVVYHGTRRPDRVGNRFRKARATSGPMAFFTAIADIASSYAEGKVDTSLEMPSDYAGWFKYKGKGMRSAVDIDRAWYQLTPEQRETISQRIYTVGYQNWDEASGPIVGDSQSIMGRDSIDWQLREARGNALRALVEIWLNSGSLFNDEQMFMQVLEAAGMDMSAVTYDSPHAVKSAVYPAYLSIQNPLNTDNIPADVMSALEQASKRKRAKRSAGGNADAWDKNTISGKDWMEVLKSDRGTSAWTRIPDWVTETLQALGYDGILDTGGKLGGPKHQVWIPFEETQVKSATGNRGTFDPNDPRIDYSISTQSEIDRVQAAMGALDRSPLDTLEITEKLRKRFASIIAENMVELAAMRQGGVAQREVLDEEGNPIGPQPDAPRTKASGAEIRRTKLLQALGELDGLLSALPPQVAAKVGGYTVLTNIGTGDRALSNFFIKRLEMIDKELERYLKDRYTKALDELFKRARPKRDEAGKTPKGKLGADIHSLFFRLEQAVDQKAVEIDGEIASLEQQIASGELEPEQEAYSILLSDALPLFGEWATADASRMAQAVQMGYDIFRVAYKKQKAKAILRKNLRDQERIDAKDASGAPDDTAPVRQKNKNEAEDFKSKTKGIVTNLLSFDQLMSLTFGRDSEFTKKWVNWQRKADNARDDEINAIYDQYAKFLATLTGHPKPYSMRATYAGQDLAYELAQPKHKIKHTNVFGEEVEFVFSQADLMDITMMGMQAKGKAHLMGRLDDDGNPMSDWSYDQSFIDKAERLLTDETKAIRDFLLNDYGNEWGALNEVFVELNDINLPQEQFYSPLSVNPVQTTQNQTIDALTGFAIAVPNRTPPSLRSRGAAVAEPVFSNAIDKWFAHRMQMAHWKAYAKFNNEALSVLGHRNVRNAVEAKLGPAGLVSLQHYLTYFQQGGNRAADANLELTKALRGILGRAMTMSLFGRIGTVLIQFTQLGAASAKMPVHAYLRRFFKLMSGQMGWGEALKSPYIQRRIAQMPPQVQVAMAGLRANKPSQIREAARRVGWLLSGNDGLSTAGTYAMVYDYQLELMKKAGMTGAQAEAAAREEAERTVDEIAQPTRAGARSAFELSQTSPLQTVAWAFGSEPRKNLALLAYLQRAKRPLNEKGRALLYVLIFNGVLAALMRTMLRDLRDDEDDEIFDWDDTWNPKRLLMMVLTEPLYGVPVLGEMTEEAIFRAAREYRPEGSLYSVADPAFSLSRVPQHLSNLLEGEVDGRMVVKDINNILRGFGYAYPTAAGAAALSNLAKEFYEMGDTIFGDDE
jgi:hypothetical protein